MSDPTTEALAAGEAGQDEQARAIVTPLLDKTVFPDDDGEDAPPEPGDGLEVDDEIDSEAGR